ncbi:hypothetical protein SAMN05660866_02519 [Maribacter arcticus]|uniref:Uncharacterized protein n=1 Tax=Maribacter arcticus TaxID=561365 RepID=A0A1T5CVK1_9FLAO|nr:hypothetical protein SAMN05660866_02519 [Maribacter arcticus]
MYFGRMRFKTIRNPIFIYQGFFRSRKWFEINEAIGNVIKPEAIAIFLTKDFYLSSSF